MDLPLIASGWYDYAKGSAETKRMMAKRLKECDTCPHKEQRNSFGEKLANLINSEASIYSCAICKCPLAVKTATKNERCPLGKWTEFTGEQSYY